VTGTFLTLGGYDVKPELTIANNLWIAPNQVTGNNGSAILKIYDPNLTGIKSFSNNIWDRTLTDAYAAGGVIYLQSSNPANNLLTPAQWSLLPIVSNDQFADPVLTGSTYQFTANGITAGAAMPR
jgi:hypothetical protein